MALVGVYGRRVNAIGWGGGEINVGFTRGQIHDFETDDVDLGQLEVWWEKSNVRCCWIDGV